MDLMAEFSTMDLTPRLRAEVMDELKKLGAADYDRDRERIQVRWQVEEDVEELWNFVEAYGQLYTLMTQDYALDFPERPDRCSGPSSTTFLGSRDG